MSQEPTAPANAFAKQQAGAPAPPPPEVPKTEEAAAGPAGEPSALEAVASINSYASRLWPAGVAIGIGSAAIAAALLYRSRK